MLNHIHNTPRVHNDLSICRKSHIKNILTKAAGVRFLFSLLAIHCVSRGVSYILYKAQISIIGRHTVPSHSLGLIPLEEMQMCSTVPVLAVKVIVLNLRNLANDPVSVPTATAGEACIRLERFPAGIQCLSCMGT